MVLVFRVAAESGPVGAAASGTEVGPSCDFIDCDRNLVVCAPFVFD